jgi:hypothetical protein
MKIKLSTLLFLSLALTVSPVIAGDPLDSWEELRAEMEKHRKEKKGRRDLNLIDLLPTEDQIRQRKREKEEREREKKNFEKDRRLAEQGDADAQVRIGREYGRYYSRVVAKDYKEALKWYKLSAAQGNAEAQYELGGIYQQGYGVVLQDYKEAIRWYKLSAEQGYGPAQNGLGNIFKILQEYTKSHKWYNIAGANGFKDALNSRDMVEEEMTPTQIIKAQKLAKEWMEKRRKR